MGNIQKITYEKRNPQPQQAVNGEFIFDNSCGTYQASVDINEIIVGEYNAKSILINGEMGEWCEFALQLNPDHYLFEVKNIDGEYISDTHIRIYKTDDNRFALLPMYGLALQKENLIEDVNFHYSTVAGLIFNPNNYSEESLRNNYRKEWFTVDESYDNKWKFKKGIYLETIKPIIQSNKTLNPLN